MLLTTKHGLHLPVWEFLLFNNLETYLLSNSHHSIRRSPACRRLLFPLLHAEKGRPFSACNKGNRRRLHAGDLRIEWCELLKRYVSRLLNKRNSHTGKCSPCLVVSSTFAHKKTKLRQVETRHQNVVRTLAWFKQRFLGKKSRTFQGLFFTTF